jgi:hypothetical protein
VLFPVPGGPRASLIISPLRKRPCWCDQKEAKAKTAVAANACCEQLGECYRVSYFEVAAENEVWAFNGTYLP